MVKIKNVSNSVYCVAGVALLPDAVGEFNDDVAIKWGLDSAFRAKHLKVVSGKLLAPVVEENPMPVVDIPIIAPVEEEEDFTVAEEEPVEEVPVEAPVEEKPKRTRKTTTTK